MERMTRRVRQSGMMSPRHVHGIVGAGLLCAAVAGCGTVAASTPAAGQAAASVSAAAASAAAASAASAVGCASVSQATVVTIHRTMRLVEPAHVGPYTMTQRKPAPGRAGPGAPPFQRLLQARRSSVPVEPADELPGRLRA